MVSKAQACLDGLLKSRVMALSRKQHDIPHLERFTAIMENRWSFLAAALGDKLQSLAGAKDMKVYADGLGPDQGPVKDSEVRKSSNALASVTAIQVKVEATKALDGVSSEWISELAKVVIGNSHWQNTYAAAVLLSHGWRGTEFVGVPVRGALALNLLAVQKALEQDIAIKAIVESRKANREPLPTDDSELLTSFSTFHSLKLRIPSIFCEDDMKQLKATRDAEFARLDKILKVVAKGSKDVEECIKSHDKKQTADTEKGQKRKDKEDQKQAAAQVKALEKKAQKDASKGGPASTIPALYTVKSDKILDFLRFADQSKLQEALGKSDFELGVPYVVEMAPELAELAAEKTVKT